MAGVYVVVVVVVCVIAAISRTSVAVDTHVANPVIASVVVVRVPGINSTGVA